MKPELPRALAPLVGLPLRSLGRAANLLWLQFGNLREAPARTGGTRTVCDWVLHIQCSWRLCRLDQIVVASRDFYYSTAGEPLDDWDKPGASRFDHTVAALGAAFETDPPAVISATPDDVGGFMLCLSHDYRLNVFLDSSDPSTEHWRIFQPGNLDSHFAFRDPTG